MFIYFFFLSFNLFPSTGRVFGLAVPFGKPRGYRPFETKRLLPSLAAQYPTIQSWSGLYFGRHGSIYRGSFLQDPMKEQLMEVNGTYQLFTENSSESIFGITYYIWEKAADDTLPVEFRLPLYKKRAGLMWMSLTDLSNMVLSFLSPTSPHLSLTEPCLDSHHEGLLLKERGRKKGLLSQEWVASSRASIDGSMQGRQGKHCCSWSLIKYNSVLFSNKSVLAYACVFS